MNRSLKRKQMMNKKRILTGAGAALALIVAVLLLLRFMPLKSPEQYYAGQTSGNNFEVSIEIDCGTVFKNWDSLDGALKQGSYLPEDGKILKKTTVRANEADSVYEVLTRTAAQHQIQLEADAGSYIKGIGYLYEFSCGALSGWIYKVNGVVPSIGCAEYKLQPGDTIEWLYTCDLGRDVGAQPPGV